MSFGQGSVTIAYRPIPFEGTFEATKVLLAMGFGDDSRCPRGTSRSRPIPRSRA